MRSHFSPLLLVLACVLASTIALKPPPALAQNTAPLRTAYSTSGQTSTFHAGQGSPTQLSVRFSQPVAAFAASTPSVEVNDGSVQGVSSSGDVFTLPTIQ